MQTKNPNSTHERRDTQQLAHATGAFGWKGTQPGAVPDVIDWLVQKVTALLPERADLRRFLRL
jgi:hypothetical protein